MIKIELVYPKKKEKIFIGTIENRGFKTDKDTPFDQHHARAIITLDAERLKEFRDLTETIMRYSDYSLN